MPKKAIITGGSGFVGTNLVEHFARRGWEVLNFDIAAPRNPAHLPYWRKVDLLDRQCLVETTAAFRPDVFLHFGARTDLNERANLGGYAANIEGVCNVIEAVRTAVGLERVIIASSQLVCRIGVIPRDEYDFCPSTLYGQSKVLSERIIRAAGEIGPAWTIVRPTSLWGPWFDVPYKNFFLTIAKNRYVHPGGVTALKQWGFIGNTVYQVERLLDAPAGQVHQKMFYLADYEPTNLRAFADLVQQSMGARAVPVVPASLLRMAGRAGDVLQQLGWKNPPLTSFRYGNIITPEVQDLEPLRQVVGPLPYSTAEGVELTARWLREQGG